MLFRSMNPAHISMFEADSKEDFVAHGVSNLYRNPSDRKTLSDRLMKDGFIRNEEIALRTLKGRPIWGSVSAVLQRDESGNVFFDGIVEDITERKKAQEEYKAILGSAMDGFWLIDSDGRFLDVNQAYCEFSGYSREELLDMRVGDVEANESQAEVAEHIRRIMEKGHDRFETRHRRKDGLIIDVEVSVSRPKGSEGRQFAFLRDISEKKRSEEALLASEARYRDLVQNANTIIIRLDVDGRIKFFNEFAQQFFSFEEHEIVGQNILGTILPRSGESGKDLAALLRNSERHPDHFLDSEYEIVGRDGKRAWIAWTSTPVYDAEGTIKELLCVGNDVTERVNAERVIDDQRARMMNTSRLSAIGTMASGIAHEINNPLATISAATQQMGTILNSESPDRNRLTKIADVVERNVNRISRIVRGLKMLARDGAFDPFTKVSVANLILETLELCQARLAAHGISLILPDIPCHLTIECIPSQISQVILNLLNNAYDAAIRMPEKWVRLEVEEQPDHVIFSVTDSGRGLSPESRMNLFVPFFTTKREGAGTGLGLSISRNIIEGHNGELMLDASSANTKFLVRVPKRQFAREVSVESEYRPHTHGENARNHSAS